MIDSNSSEFKTVVAEFVRAIKTMDTALYSYHMAFASLEQAFPDAANQVRFVTTESLKDPHLSALMRHKYDATLAKWEQLAPQSDFLTVFVSLLQAFQLETPKQS